MRVPSARDEAARLEHRLSDGAAVVHTSHWPPSCRRARLGVVGQVDPGAPEGGNGLDAIDATVGVPASLSEALDELEADAALVEAVGAELVAQHLAVKRTEWERYLGHDGLGAARVPAVPLAPGHAHREVLDPADEVRAQPLALAGALDR